MFYLKTAFCDQFQMCQHLVARVLLVLCLPLVLYMATFYVHLQVLYKAGPHDDVMTSAFQASLQVGYLYTCNLATSATQGNDHQKVLEIWRHQILTVEAYPR